MTVRATAKITLGIKGPFICSATAPAGWGLDATFDRDYLGRPYIDRSHIKGKLREALIELTTDTTMVKELLGDEGDRSNGMIYLSDFYLADKTQEGNYRNTLSKDLIHRIRMDEKRGVAEDNALMMFEELIAVNSTSEWAGELIFHAASKDAAVELIKEISTGLKWISAFGAEKGVGFGKLLTVKVEPPTIENTGGAAGKTSLPVPSGKSLSLVITTEEPLMLGDVKIKDNFQESREYIYGSAIKAALAQAMNTACGVARPAATAIDSSNKTVAAAWPLLTKYFSQIRFTHAFPSLEQKRPRIIPFSVVKAKKHYDVALVPEARTFDGIAPVFQTDWKDSDYPTGFGWASPRKFAKTRTAIDGNSRHAKKGSMFTYQYVCPQTSKEKPIQWIADASLEGITLEGSESLDQLKTELVSALGQMEFLGKRSSRVSVKTMNKLPAFLADAAPKTQERVILSLQSDALMINPDTFKANQSEENLRKNYQSYFQENFGPGCTLFNFFAMQKMLGGYIKHRDKKDKNGYYPYFLTTAGSVFVLAGADAEKVKGALASGLPLPPWAGVGPEAWKTCPFVPENGFGEIAMIHETMKTSLGIGEGGEAA